MEDDCDYMSDELLVACTSSDIRPGLIHNRQRQREHDLAKKREEIQKNKPPSLKQLESELLSKGLERPLGPENKGFSMLQKMGFKLGSGLGNNESGIVEPIEINLKVDRKGLGRKQALDDIRTRKKLIRENQKQTSVNVSDYRAGLSKKYRERDILSDLHKSQKASYRLDSEMGIKNPEELWFWPDNCLPTNDEDEELDEDDSNGKTSVSDDYSSAEKLEMLTIYLRKSYFYCIWCGTQYDDEKDLALCPGPTREDH